MKRTATAILGADFHLRDSVPECRTDDYIETMLGKWEFLRKLQAQHYDKIPILVAGDLFNHWKPSPWLLSLALRFLPDNIIAVPGQHDLPNHVIENIDKSGIQVLADAGKIHLLEPGTDLTIPIYRGIQVVGFPWGTPLTEAEDCPANKHRAIALIHYGVYHNTPHYPGAEVKGGSAATVLKQMDGYDLIVSGDNHQCFTAKRGNSILVNPGSLMRNTAAQVDHKPSVFLWYAEDNSVEQVFIPIDKKAVSREHIEVVQEQDERIEAFVSKLDKNIELGFSFEHNMQQTIAKNDVNPAVEKIIWRCMGK